MFLNAACLAGCAGLHERQILPSAAHLPAQPPEPMAAMAFFSVPTVTFSVLYVFFIIGHDRRRILHCSVTRHPTSAWIVQQLRDAFPYDPQPSSPS